MEELHPRCAGIDIGKRYAKVCVRTPGPGGRGKAGRVSEVVTTWGSMTSQIMALRAHLVDQQVTCVVMEATSDYWRPYFYLLEDLADDVPGCEVMVVNARHVKQVPGRKSDVADATWLAQLGAHGLVRASFVPPPPIRELRDLTRTRTALVHDRNRELNRLEKLLEGAGIKITAVLSELDGVSGMAILRGLASGERDPATLAALAHWRLNGKRAQLIEALTGRFSDHHGYIVATHLRLLDELTHLIKDLDERIEVVIEPFRGFRDLICSIPGISTRVAEVITAETGADMTQFPTPHQLASWAGVCPGNNESAGRIGTTATRPGNSYLKGALGIAAMSAARTKNTYYHSKYARLATRRGPKRATVAIMHDMLTTIWHMAQTGELYQDPGPDHYQRHDRNQLRYARKIAEQAGYELIKKAS